MSENPVVLLDGPYAGRVFPAPEGADRLTIPKGVYDSVPAGPLADIYGRAVASHVGYHILEIEVFGRTLTVGLLTTEPDPDQIRALLWDVLVTPVLAGTVVP